MKDVSAKSFLSAIVKAFSPQCFVVGHNNFFGKDKKGNLEFLNKNKKNYSFEIVAEEEIFKNLNL